MPDLGITADQVADGNRCKKTKLLDCRRRDPALGLTYGQYAAGNVHLGHQPATKNIAVGICVRGHGHHTVGHLAVSRVIRDRRSVFQ